MKKALSIMAVFGFIFSLVSFVPSQELITGQTRAKFTPGDKILFQQDFSQCPVGEFPEGFEKFTGAGECVRFGDQIWVAPSTDADFRLYKKLSLGRGDFSFEFDFVILQDISGAVGPKLILRFLESRGSAWDKAKAPYDLEIYGDYHNCSVKLEKVGHIGKIEKVDKKILHLAVQVRRGQFRVFLNGQRLTSIPFQVTPNEEISGFEFMFVTDTNRYGLLISNIKAAKYTQAEERPSPESLGIKVEKKGNETQFTLPESILFDFNEFFLKPEAKKALKILAQLIKEQPNKKILITGYTDNVGSDSYNLRLSLQRAQSVADYLIYVEGISKEIITIEGKGKANPVADNSTEEGRAKNRRVEVKIY
ncbi:MAG: OmpA family protein [Candidatus Aminicenantes bacterium]|nr:OmpA family protein [Candidatus Aminicenantes bacterium]